MYYFQRRKECIWAEWKGEMQSILVVFNKHNTARVASCWFIIYYIYYSIISPFHSTFSISELLPYVQMCHMGQTATLNSIDFALKNIVGLYHDASSYECKKNVLVIVVSDLMSSRRHNKLRSPLAAVLRDNSRLSSKI